MAILGLGGPRAAGPASAGVAPPESVEASVIDDSVQDEQINNEKYADALQVFDEYTGGELPAELVRKARAAQLT